MKTVSREDAKTPSYKRFVATIKDALTHSSFRRMPESTVIKALDSGMRRNDGQPKKLMTLGLLGAFASLRETKNLSASHA